MRAYEIKKYLQTRHTKDFYATEVKTGESWGNNYLQFDAYAIKKSWVNLKYTGYEIKVARGDFKQDDKWRGYLPFCNEFYWVCPKDLIKADEIEEECGLIYVYPETFVMRTVKKAKYREIKPPVTLLLYLIMWQVENPKFPFFDDKLDYFKYWLLRKDFSKDLGYQVSKTFRKKLNEIKQIEDKNKEYKEQLYDYYKIIALLKKHDINYSYFTNHIDLEDLERRLCGSVPKDINRYISDIQRGLENLKSSFAEKI